MNECGDNGNKISKTEMGTGSLVSGTHVIKLLCLRVLVFDFQAIPKQPPADADTPSIDQKESAASLKRSRASEACLHRDGNIQTPAMQLIVNDKPSLFVSNLGEQSF